MNYETADYVQWPLSFRNDSAETVPPFGLMIGKNPGTTVTDLGGNIAILCDKQGTTFERTLYSNSRFAVLPGKFGRCAELGAAPVAHDPDWTPVRGEGGGAKPNSWLLWKGFPCCATVQGIASAEAKLILATLSPVGTLLCKATDDLTAGSISSNFTIQSGDPSSNADAGFTTLPTLHLGVPIDDTNIFYAFWANNCWVAVPWECNA